jgi:hypothetical protein
MAQAIVAIIGGLILILLGLSGSFVLKGTNSKTALIIFGIIALVAGISLLIGSTLKKKKKGITQKDINDIIENGAALLTPVLLIKNNISGRSYNLYITSDKIIVDRTLKEAEIRYDKFNIEEVINFSKKNIALSNEDILKIKIIMKPKMAVGYSSIEINTNKAKIKGLFQNSNFENIMSALKLQLHDKLEIQE